MSWLTVGEKCFSHDTLPHVAGGLSSVTRFISKSPQQNPTRHHSRTNPVSPRVKRSQVLTDS